MHASMLIIAVLAVVVIMIITISKNSGKTLRGKTIVFVRHGEKPYLGLGQLDCKGLNRSLALPDVLVSKYGIPTKIYAPDPTVKKEDKGEKYYYIRPLATIEPTAIALGMPVDIKYGVTQVHEIANDLYVSKDKTIFVAWEHVQLVKIVRVLIEKYGASPNNVPEWKESDFDSIYVINIHDDKVTFYHDHQGLDNRSSSCPR
ncbi:hypothetical protein FK949_gp026 [Paramecium bursaria Chlorella virus NYs1]|uniref:Histidine phosphatase family protein n=1 Tax=Paramecium bursaria Chlorella virus NYs1 TaxID=83442 RepID=M1I8K3_9PHYC|nr:hypothetical protein FK949_gp026 [Paramecium bursaria Chlorella virus NYs1]AGE58591.1 hypothetical protein PBCVNYs1_073L [Paramecium bursaria Chlorella virus NYs1]